MSWNLDETDDRGRWNLAGPLEIATAALLRDRLVGLSQLDSFQSLDLSGVDSCDITSLQVLIAFRKAMEKAGRRQPIENPSARLQAACDDLGLATGELYIA